MAAVAPAASGPTLDQNPADANGDTNGVEAGENVTVFHDPENFNVVHPLANSWTLWFTKPPTGKVQHLPTAQKTCC